jgi:hypothetical protein
MQKQQEEEEQKKALEAAENMVSNTEAKVDLNELKADAADVDIDDI